MQKIAVSAACAVLILEGMVILQLYELDAASGALAGATDGGLGMAIAKIRRSATRRNILRKRRRP